jgi:hypothetical protein
VSNINEAINLIRTQGAQSLSAVEEETILRKAREGHPYAGVDTNSFQINLTPGDGQYGSTNVGAGPTAPSFTIATVDLTGFRECRLTQYQTCANGNTATTYAQYSLDNGSTWVTLIPAADGIPFSNGTGWARTEWVDVPEAARTMCMVRYVVGGGDGVEDIGIYGPILQFRS